MLTVITVILASLFIAAAVMINLIGIFLFLDKIL